MLSLFRFLKGKKFSKEDFLLMYPNGLAPRSGKNKEKGYANYDNQWVIRLTDEDGNITFATEKDINWEDETVKEYEASVRKLHSSYYFSGERFINGIALIVWTIYPDGRYFEDEDGFGGESNNEVNLYCYINTQGKTVIPFQSMTDQQIIENRAKAEKALAI